MLEEGTFLYHAIKENVLTPNDTHSSEVKCDVLNVPRTDSHLQFMSSYSWTVLPFPPFSPLSIHEINEPNENSCTPLNSAIRLLSTCSSANCAVLKVRNFQPRLSDICPAELQPSSPSTTWVMRLLGHPTVFRGGDSTAPPAPGPSPRGRRTSACSAKSTSQRDDQQHTEPPRECFGGLPPCPSRCRRSPAVDLLGSTKFPYSIGYSEPSFYILIS